MRYNFKKQIGEVNIDKEYSQRCPVHRGPPVHAMVGDMGGSKWVMQKVMRFIRARFYLDQKSGNQNRRTSISRSDVLCSGCQVLALALSPAPEPVWTGWDVLLTSGHHHHHH